MISGILTLLLFLFVAIVVATFVGAFKVFRNLRDFTQKLNRQQPFSGAQGRQYGENGGGVIDTRSQEKANRKIFSKDEGEFVDYKEE